MPSLTQLWAPYITYLNTWTRLHISIHCRFVSAPTSAKSNITSTESSANQNQTLRHPSRQPIRIEYYVTLVEHPSRQYVTRELSAPGRPFSALGSSRLAIAYLNTWGRPPPCLAQLTLLLLMYPDEDSLYERFSLQKFIFS